MIAGAFPAVACFLGSGWHDSGMATTTRTQRRYDHRLRHLVRTTRDIDYALQRGVPRSTARSWLTLPQAEVVSVDVLNLDTLRLQHEVLRLRARRVARPEVLPQFVPQVLFLFRTPA
jgi:hypothetical protein